MLPPEGDERKVAVRVVGLGSPLFSLLRPVGFTFHAIKTYCILTVMQRVRVRQRRSKQIITESETFLACEAL